MSPVIWQRTSLTASRPHRLELGRRSRQASLDIRSRMQKPPQASPAIQLNLSRPMPYLDNRRKAHMKRRDRGAGGIATPADTRLIAIVTIHLHIDLAPPTRLAMPLSLRAQACPQRRSRILLLPHSPSRLHAPKTFRMHARHSGQACPDHLGSKKESKPRVYMVMRGRRPLSRSQHVRYVTIRNTSAL